MQLTFLPQESGRAVPACPGLRLRRLALPLFASTIMAFLPACSRDRDPPPAKQEDLAAIAYALGGKGDLSYNDAAAAAVTFLRSQHYRVLEFEPPSADQYRQGLEALVRQRPRFVFCVGYLYDDPVVKVAEQAPAIDFVVLDGTVHRQNVWSIKFNSAEGSQLAGVVAASLSKTGIVAFIGGMNIPIINEFRDGFKAGVRRIRPETQVLSLYVGASPSAFTDPVKGKETALTALARRADVLFHAAGTSGNGVIDAAREAGARAIGVDVDQSHLARGIVVTSVVKNFSRAVEYFVQQRAAGRLTVGEIVLLGYKQGAVDLSPLDPQVQASVGAHLDDLRRELRLAP